MQNEPSASPHALGQPQTSARRRRAVAAIAATLGATAIVSTVAPAPADAFTRRVGTVWGRVAQCESSRRWHVNTGNGYYGGLQFTRSTWNSFGGKTYARTANHASRLEQIAIAEKVLRVQGWNAWPSCSAQAGAR